MDFSFATCAALFLLLAAASSAPTALQDACADVQTSSLALNRIAKTVAVKARNGSTDMADFENSLAWMEAKDMCDPGTLKQKSTMCIEKILSVLTRYSFELGKISNIENWSKDAREVKDKLDKLHQDINKCAWSIGGLKHEEELHISEEGTVSAENRDLWCYYVMDRLFSFSILTARVFAVGDPSHHSEGSAQRCM